MSPNPALAAGYGDASDETPGQMRAVGVDLYAGVLLEHSDDFSGFVVRDVVDVDIGTDDRRSRLGRRRRLRCLARDGEYGSERDFRPERLRVEVHGFTGHVVVVVDDTAVLPS